MSSLSYHRHNRNFLCTLGFQRAVVAGVVMVSYIMIQGLVW